MILIFFEGKSIELEQTSLTTLNNNNNNMGGISANSGQIGSGNILMATNTTATAMINNNSTITGSGNLTTTTGLVTSGSQKKVRKSIRNFFVSTSKFQKTMKRGAIYLASLIYNGTDKRVLVTNEEVLPIIEIGKENLFSMFLIDFSMFFIHTR